MITKLVRLLARDTWKVQATGFTEAHEQYIQTADVQTVVPIGASVLALTSGGYEDKRGREQCCRFSRNTA